MLAFFPAPYPDELLYSLCARYARLMGYRNRDRANLSYLYGQTVMTSVVDLPIYLNVFADQLEFLGGPSADEIIDRHTLLPYYVAFHSFEQREAVRSAMRGKDRPYSRLGLSASRVVSPETLRYCPSCAAEERTRYGEAYWHRLHQLPGVVICPEHGVWIEDSAAQVSRLRARRAFEAAETIIPHSDCARKPTSGSEGNLFTDLAHRARDALVEPPVDVEPQILRERYRYFLAERGLATYFGRLRPEALGAAFREFCAMETLGKLGLLQASGEWLLRIMHQSERKRSHTLHHLLLHAFLNLDRGDLTSPIQPFGEGPWPCLNRASSHYGEKRITSIRVDYTSHPIRPIGTFICSCGFGYRRAGPDRAPEAAYHRTRIHSYGSIWVRTLRRGWLTPGLSLDSLARQLGVAVETMRSQAQELGLPNRPGSRRAAGGEGTASLEPELKKPVDTSFAQKRNLHRNVWLRAWREQPDASISTLRRLLPATYRWLCTHDRNWYDKNKPIRRVTWTAAPTVDWKQRDIELADQLRHCASQLYAQDPPVKVTRTRLAREIGAQGLLWHFKDKLPECMRTLDELKETREGIAIRRIDSTAARLHRSGERVSRYLFIQIAGLHYELRTGNSIVVRQALKQALKELETRDRKPCLAQYEEGQGLTLLGEGLDPPSSVLKVTYSR